MPEFELKKQWPIIFAVDKPDVGFHAADFDIGLIRNKDVARMIIVMIHEGFHTDGGCLTVIRDLLA